MAFPATQLGLMVELGLGADLGAAVTTWSWTDITHYVRFADGITITRGRRDEFSTAGPAQARLTLLNDGRFVVRNPVGPYYGLIARNTPLRVMVRPDVNSTTDAFGRTTSNGWGTADSGQPWTVVGTAADYSTTSGVARATHGSAAVRHYGVLPASQLTVDVAFRVRTGALATGAALSAGVVFHYADASNSNRFDVLFGTDQTISVRAAIRGAGTDAFGATHLVTGLTHAANTFYQVRVQTHSANARQVRIKVWADGTAEPGTWAGYSTINGNTSAGLTGLTSSRETGNTNASATVDFDDLTLTDGWFPRHTGYVDEWPTRWNDAGLKQMLAPITASGLSRRLGQGSTLASAIRRGVLTAGRTPRAYWPCEDKSTASTIASGISGGLPMRITQPMTLGSGQAAGSDPLAVASPGGRLLGTVQPYVGTDWTVMALVDVPAAAGVAQDLLVWTTSGSYVAWQLVLTPSAGADQLALQAYDSAGVEHIIDVGTNFGGEPYGQQMWVEVSAAQVGADINWSYSVWVAGTSFGKVSTRTGATAGTVTSISYGNGAGSSSNVIVGHFSVWDSAAISLGSFASTGWAGESATARFTRLGAQEMVPATLVASPVYDVATMGAPTSSTLLAQFLEIAGADQGILYDDVDGSEALLPREARFNQAVALTLDVSQHQVGWPLDPADDDQQLHNDVTSTQPTGSSYRFMDTTSANAVSEVGYYSATRSVNLAYAADLRQDSEFAVALGTVDEIRYPQVPIDFNRNPGLIPAWLNTNVGARMQITHPPSLLTPDVIDLIAQGWTERLDTERWTAVVNTSSAKPWNAWIAETGTGNQSRPDSATSSIAVNATSSATSIAVTTTDVGDLFTMTGGDYPFDVGAAGEQMTASACAAFLTETFTRTTANGWGTADTGQVWTTAGGAASDYSTNGTQGVHNLSTTVTQRLSSLALAIGPPLEVLADWVHIPTAPTGAGAVTLSLIACGRDVNNYVALQFFATVGSTMTVAVEQVSGGSVVAQDVTFPSVGTLTATYSARLHITNTLIQGRVWVRGTTEPTTWTTSVATTSTPSAGDVAWRTERAAGTTNASPFFIELDGLSLPLTQLFTVTRHVNGVVKAQTALDPLGAPTRFGLWNPSVLAL